MCKKLILMKLGANYTGIMAAQKCRHGKLVCHKLPVHPIIS